MRQAFALCFLLLSAQPALAQAGHPPDKSPYRDVTKRMSVTGLLGYVGGDGGVFGLGPHDGLAYGGAFGLAISGPLEFTFGVQWADLQGKRVYRDLDGKLTTGGLIPTPVWMFETDVQFNITGGKTWKGLAPYIGGGLGYGWRTSNNVGDEYGFGGRFYWVAFAGTRFYVGPRTFIKAEIRGAFWRLAYPPSYYDIDYGFLESYAINNYLSTGWYQVGLGISF